MDPHEDAVRCQTVNHRFPRASVESATGDYPRNCGFWTLSVCGFRAVSLYENSGRSPCDCLTPWLDGEQREETNEGKNVESRRVC